MYCPRCGSDTPQDASFCPTCGAWLDGREVYTEPPARPKRRGLKVAAIAVVLVAVLAVVNATAPGDDPGTGDAYDEPESYRITVGDLISVSGSAFDDGTMTAEVGDSNTLIVSLNPEIADRYTFFNWQLTGPNGTTSRPDSDGSITIYLDGSRPGDYTLSVTCWGSHSYSPASYSGNVHLGGDVTDNYTWTYDGRTFSASSTYSYSDYYGYSTDRTVDRSTMWSGDFSGIIDLVKVDDTITGLEQSLRTAYLDAYGADASTTGQEYADYILAFVQICFTYVTDYTLYDTEEYWAYPLETLYNGAGDCEDTSILCAALYSAAGYSTGLFLIPNHAIAAVGISAYETPSVSMSTVGYSVFSYTYGGVNYYGCETTADRAMAVGLISSDYSITQNGTVYYQGEQADRIYGLQLVPASS